MARSGDRDVGGIYVRCSRAVCGEDCCGKAGRIARLRFVNGSGGGPRRVSLLVFACEGILARDDIDLDLPIRAAQPAGWRVYDAASGSAHNNMTTIFTMP
ncbi:hypothetical protein KCP71_24245 [Salmonella enterica subsp. enterica]|nr:hypothetical protein KCP71_24245 [Salmonella enterica subsp. enterica]